MGSDLTEQLNKLWPSKPELVIATTSSRLAFFDKHVEKYRINRDQVDSRQKRKSEAFLSMQKVGYKKDSANLDDGPVEVISIRRFAHSDCAASQYRSLDSDKIQQIFRSAQRLLEKCELEKFDELSFKLGVSENTDRQRDWAAQNLPEILRKKLDDYFITTQSLVEKFLATYNETSVPLVHGDLHLGNVFVRGHRTYILDPAENDIRFCLVPPWLEYASLAASLVLLAREDLADDLLERVRSAHTDFDARLFDLWVTLKILVRLRFEESFLALNDSLSDQDLVKWRRELVDNGPDRLGLWLTRVSHAPSDSAPISVVTPTVLEALRASNQVIESRRNELNAKSNVYVAVAISLVAGNIAFLDQNANAFSPANVLLLVSAGLALFSAWRFLDLVRTLTGRSKAPKSRGQLLFFGWWARSDPAELARKLNYLDEMTFANELAVQNASLAKNIRFRYTAQTSASKTLGIALLVFFLGISVQVLGFGVDQISFPLRENTPSVPSANTPSVPPVNTVQGNVP